MINWLKSFFIDRTFGIARSQFWDEVRNEHIKQYPKCAICGKIRVLVSNHVHHILPFWKYPELETKTSNLITLCPRHHFELGHFFSWHSWNKDIRQLVENIRNRP